MRKALNLDHLFHKGTTLNTGPNIWKKKITSTFFPVFKILHGPGPLTVHSWVFAILLSRNKIKLREILGEQFTTSYSNIETTLIWIPFNLPNPLTNSQQVLPLTFQQIFVPCYKVCNSYSQTYAAKLYSSGLQAVIS